MRLGTWLAIGAVALVLLAKSQRWYEDLMLRAFARETSRRMTTPLKASEICSWPQAQPLR